MARADDNAAAAAWRTGERVIVSSTHDSAAAIVIPVLGIDTCLGVLAFEVPDGREHDAATHAVAAIIAAQLATIVATPSTERATAPGESGPVEPEHESRVQSASAAGRRCAAYEATGFRAPSRHAGAGRSLRGLVEVSF